MQPFVPVAGSAAGTVSSESESPGAKAPLPFMWDSLLYTGAQWCRWQRRHTRTHTLLSGTYCSTLVLSCVGDRQVLLVFKVEKIKALSKL